MLSDFNTRTMHRRGCQLCQSSTRLVGADRIWDMGSWEPSPERSPLTLRWPGDAHNQETTPKLNCILVPMRSDQNINEFLRMPNNPALYWILQPVFLTVFKAAVTIVGRDW